MNYKDKLNPWCIIRPISSVQMRIVGRFRRRSDAEGHLQILKRMMPNVPFEIMFDIATENLIPQLLTQTCPSLSEKESQKSDPPPLPGEGLGERSTEE